MSRKSTHPEKPCPFCKEPVILVSYPDADGVEQHTALDPRVKLFRLVGVKKAAPCEDQNLMADHRAFCETIGKAERTQQGQRDAHTSEQHKPTQSLLPEVDDTPLPSAPSSPTEEEDTGVLEW